MIISIYGPDGVGKSTIARLLESELVGRGKDVLVFSGTHVEEWPDKQWHYEFIKNGIDESSVDAPDHFIEKIVRCHSMASALEQQHEVVIIDSDPLHKTLMHAYKNAKKNEEDPELNLNIKLRELNKLLSEKGLQFPHNSLYITLDADLDKHGQILMKRIRGRGPLAFFDPKTKQDARYLSEAANALNARLMESGKNVLTVASDAPIDIGELADQIVAI